MANPLSLYLFLSPPLPPVFHREKFHINKHTQVTGFGVHLNLAINFEDPAKNTTCDREDNLGWLSVGCILPVDCQERACCENLKTCLWIPSVGGGAEVGRSLELSG